MRYALVIGFYMGIGCGFVFSQHGMYVRRCACSISAFPWAMVTTDRQHRIYSRFWCEKPMFPCINTHNKHTLGHMVFVMVAYRKINNPPLHAVFFLLYFRWGTFGYKLFGEFCVEAVVMNMMISVANSTMFNI